MDLAKLTTLTPVHVGNGDKLLRDFDFVVDREKVGFLDLEKIVSIIEVERLPQLTSEIENKSVISYLKRTIPNFNLENICSRITKNKAGNSKCNELKRHYFTSLFDTSIPGSSLKGSIKTAMWETIATKEKQSNWIESDYKNKYGKFNSDIIDKRIFGSTANDKTTRFLKIGDIYFSGVITEVYEIGILNAGRREWFFKENQSFLAECLPSGITANFSFKIDDLLLNKNLQYHPHKWKGLSTSFFESRISFCLMLNNYTNRQLGYELEELEEEGFGEHEAGELMLNRLQELKADCEEAIKRKMPVAIVRVGGNSGWNFTTGGWVKSSPLSDSAYINLRKVVQKKEYNMDLWPKTRKLTHSGIPLGFVKIEI